MIDVLTGVAAPACLLRRSPDGRTAGIRRRDAGNACSAAGRGYIRPILREHDGDPYEAESGAEAIAKARQVVALRRRIH
ncbi:hypothetical protein [Nonomuraea sp. NPDC003214]